MGGKRLGGMAHGKQHGQSDGTYGHIRERHTEKSTTLHCPADGEKMDGHGCGSGKVECYRVLSVKGGGRISLLLKTKGV